MGKIWYPSCAFCPPAGHHGKFGIGLRQKSLDRLQSLPETSGQLDTMCSLSHGLSHWLPFWTGFLCEALLKLGKGIAGILNVSRRGVLQTSAGVVDQQRANTFTLETVKYRLSLGQPMGKIGTRLSEWHDATAQYGHGRLFWGAQNSTQLTVLLKRLPIQASSGRHSNQSKTHPARSHSRQNAFGFCRTPKGFTLCAAIPVSLAALRCVPKLRMLRKSSRHSGKSQNSRLHY